MFNAIRICCNNIAYRKGFIEVRADIHNGFINLETWNVHPDIAISPIDSELGQLQEGSITGNTEIELSIDEAERLIRLLQTALEEARRC